MPEQLERLRILKTALRAFRGGRVAIPLIGYPDPDAMASAWALAELIAREGATPEVLHCYPVSHVENQLMVRELGIPLRQVGDLGSVAEFSCHALVDTADLDWRFEPLRALPCLAVWDHHGGELGVRALATDIRDSVGATSTIATEYLDVAGIIDAAGPEPTCAGTPPSKAHTALSRLATALLLGIATDTQDYLLAQEADFAASARLARVADRATLRRIHHRAYSVSAMDGLRRALQSVERSCRGGIAWIGALHPSRRDTLPQAADLLLKREDLDTVVVYARIGNTIDGSVRTLRAGLDVAELIVHALGRKGFSGGREGMGGFRLPLQDAFPAAVRRLRLQIAQGFLAAFAEPEERWVKGGD